MFSHNMKKLGHKTDALIKIKMNAPIQSAESTMQYLNLIAQSGTKTRTMGNI